jgi:hypothetical protein
MNQEKLNNYFKNKWTPTKLSDYETSGLALLTRLNPNDQVIDIGCGLNLFKDKIPNLIGIDPVFDQADIKTTLEEFTTDRKFNVALCLDSVMFGSEEHILHQIDCITKLLTPSATIHWRFNSNLQQYKKEKIEIYNWNFGHLLKFSRLFGFRVFEIRTDANNSFYFCWVR